MLAFHSVWQTLIRSFNIPVKPLPPKAMTKTSTSLLRRASVLCSRSMRALVMEKIRSTPNDTPTQGMLALGWNMPTRLSYRPPAATLPTPTVGSLERSSSSRLPDLDLSFLPDFCSFWASGASDDDEGRVDCCKGGADPSVTTS